MRNDNVDLLGWPHCTWWLGLLPQALVGPSPKWWCGIIPPRANHLQESSKVVVFVFPLEQTQENLDMFEHKAGLTDDAYSPHKGLSAEETHFHRRADAVSVSIGKNKELGNPKDDCSKNCFVPGLFSAVLMFTKASMTSQISWSKNLIKTTILQRLFIHALYSADETWMVYKNKKEKNTFFKWKCVLTQCIVVYFFSRDFCEISRAL